MREGSTKWIQARSTAKKKAVSDSFLLEGFTWIRMLVEPVDMTTSRPLLI